MEILSQLPANRPSIRAALFDFDGTLSTLRNGWEDIMEPLMLECIAGDTARDDALVRMVREYIDQSTGIQTIHQMEWLAGAVKSAGRNPGMPEDPWWYKEEYNRRLLAMIAERIEAVRTGEEPAERWRMRGALGFVQALKERGVSIYVASGTDEEDVRSEAELLGFLPYFDVVAGAQPRRKDCSKEAVLRDLLRQHGLQGEEVAVFGDGRVEIALGRQAGALCIGMIGTEADRGLQEDAQKRRRLTEAGAHAFIVNYEEADELLRLLQLHREGKSI